MSDYYKCQTFDSMWFYLMVYADRNYKVYLYVRTWAHRMKPYRFKSETKCMWHIFETMELMSDYYNGLTFVSMLFYLMVYRDDDY